MAGLSGSWVPMMSRVSSSWASTWWDSTQRNEEQKNRGNAPVIAEWTGIKQHEGKWYLIWWRQRKSRSACVLLSLLSVLMASSTMQSGLNPCVFDRWPSRDAIFSLTELSFSCERKEATRWSVSFRTVNLAWVWNADLWIHYVLKQ